MGTSTSFDAFGNKLERLGHEMHDSRRPLNVTALEAKRTMQATAGGVIGARPTGKRKAITVSCDVRGAGSSASALVGYRGPAQLVNDRTSAHMIYPRRRALRFRAGDGGFATSAHHPGTTGKHFYEKAKVVIKKQAPNTYGKAAMTEPLARVFH
jgi:hypothetical protein